jgi:hypothetical protein
MFMLVLVRISVRRPGLDLFIKQAPRSLPNYLQREPRRLHSRSWQRPFINWLQPSSEIGAMVCAPAGTIEIPAGASSTMVQGSTAILLHGQEGRILLVISCRPHLIEL